MKETISTVKTRISSFRVILLTLKNLLICVPNYLKKSLLRFSSWFPAFSYGPGSEHKVHQKEIFVSQEQKIGLNARNRTFQDQSNKVKPNKLANETALASLNVRLSNSLLLFWLNKRLRWGMIILLIIAPASKFAYKLFPYDGFGEYFINTSFLKIRNTIEGPDWYYNEFYWWAFACAEIWSPILAIIGVFLLFPRGYYPAYLTGVPFGYYLSLLIHRMFVSTTPEYHQGIELSSTIMFIIFGVVLFAISDKILFNTNHRERAIHARIVGLINMPGMSWNDKEELLKKEAKEAMKEDNELFSRTG